jgi:hypothetical protein
MQSFLQQHGMVIIAIICLNIGLSMAAKMLGMFMDKTSDKEQAIYSWLNRIAGWMKNIILYCVANVPSNIPPELIKMMNDAQASDSSSNPQPPAAK